MSKIKRNHASSRSIVCLICRYKIFKNARILKDKTVLTITIRENYELFHNYDPDDMTLPNAVCSTCARALNNCNKASINQDKAVLPRVKVCAYDHITHTPVAPHTRSCSNSSPCDICQIASQRHKPPTRAPCECPLCKDTNIQRPKVQKVNEQAIPFQFSVNNLFEIQAQQNTSNTQMIKLAKSIRSICGRKAVEPGFREKLGERSKKLEEFYTNVTLPFYINDKIGYENRVLTYCHDIEALVDYVLLARNYDLQNHIVRIGLDGGGGMFKIIMNVIDTAIEDATDPKPSASFNFKDTGVRKVIFIAAIEKIKESYDNLALILSQIENLDRIKFFICSDIKLINIIIGIQSCSAKHPCPYCDTDDLKNFNQNFDYRTLGSITGSSTAYKDAGSVSVNAKLYNNCVNKPLLPGDANERIIDLCAPPELHLMQGIVKHVYDKMYTEWSNVSLWLKKINVDQRNYHHGSFVGNDCFKMLKNVDILQHIAPLDMQKYVHVLRCLHKIVVACFGMELDPDFEDCIKDFKEVYLTLGISVTPKVHILIEHVPGFCLNQGRSLGLYSEQALESCHYDFQKNCWEKQGYKRSIGHPDYAEKLTAAVTAYSSKHIL